MFDRLIAAAAIGVILAAIPARAAEEVACSPLAAITKALANSKFHETPVAKAIGASGVMLIVYAAPDGATWTMIGVKPDRPDVGCWLAIGKDWTAVPPGMKS